MFVTAFFPSFTNYYKCLSKTRSNMNFNFLFSFPVGPNMTLNKLFVVVVVSVDETARIVLQRCISLLVVQLAMMLGMPKGELV